MNLTNPLTGRFLGRNYVGQAALRCAAFLDVSPRLPNWRRIGGGRGRRFDRRRPIFPQKRLPPSDRGIVTEGLGIKRRCECHDLFTQNVGSFATRDHAEMCVMSMTIGKPNPITRGPGRPRGGVNTPEHRAAISNAAAAYRGFTDQEVVEYYRVPHTLRECGEWFGLTHQRISQILKKSDAARPRGRSLSSWKKAQKA